MPPTIGDVLIGAFAVLLGALAMTASAYAGRSTGNWLYFISTLGSAAFVAGVVGQRVFPSSAAIKSLGATAAATSAPGPWDAGVSLPVIGIRLTPVAVAGMLAAAVGLSLVLLFERVPDPARVPAPLPRRLEDDDAV